MSHILCSLKNLTLSHGSKYLFNQASLIIHNNDHIGLIGLNGAGKSSLLKIINGDLAPNDSQPPFIFDKAKDEKNNKATFSTFLVPQEFPLFSNKKQTIKNYLFNFYPKLRQINNQLSQINLKLEKSSDRNLIDMQKSLIEKFEHLGGWNLINTYESYLKYLGISELNRDVYQLSGGEQKKILLALGLSSPANLILWDEPTNHIDIDTIKTLEEEILGQNKSFIIITHDRYLLSKLTQKIFHIDQGQGKIRIFDGSYSDYLGHLKNKDLLRIKVLERLENNLRRETEWMRQGIKARGTRSKKRVENFYELQNKIKLLKELAKKTLELNLQKSQRQTKVLIECKHASFSYQNQDKSSLFDNLNFILRKNDKIGLIGPNGAGKTTLINLIIGTLQFKQGSIKRAENITIHCFSQKRDDLNPNKTPYELIGDGSDFVILPDGQKRHITSYFESFLFSRTDMNRPIKTFSGGEKNRLQLALNLKRTGDLLIFDEPTNDLDLETLQILEQKLSEFKGAVILVSHDRTFLDTVTDKSWFIHNNRLEIFEGGYSQIEPYLEALEFENMANKINLAEQKVCPETSKKAKSKNRLSNKEKIRLKNIKHEITNCENQLCKIEDQITHFDFSNMDQKKNDLFQELSHQRTTLENTLLKLYNEQEELKTKDQ